MSSQPRPQAIIFDFDLTLVDSLDGFFASHSFAAEALSLPSPSREAVGRLIGTPLPLAFEALYGAEHAALVDEYLRLVQARADEVMVPNTYLLPGAAETVQRLHAAGFRLAIVSQKRRYRIEPVLARAGLASAFDAVLGDEDLPALKPDPHGLLLAAERLQASPTAALYVGDTVIDAEAARRAAIPFVAVLSGLTRRDEFAPYAPVAILEGVAALPGYLQLESAV